MILGFIGCGNMGEAMLAGALLSGWITGDKVLVHTRTEARMDELSIKYSINKASKNAEVAEGADFLILAVKPNVYKSTLLEIKEFIRPNTVVLGIAPAYSIAMIKELIGDDNAKIARSIPNTPAQVGKGIAGVSFSDSMNAEDRKMVVSFFNSFGTAVEVDEGLLPAVGTLTGSGPAFVYMFIEALAQAGIKHGIPTKEAYKFAAGTVEGAAVLVEKSDKHPAKLRDEVCSPGGTTIEGVAALEENGFTSAVISAVEASIEKFMKMQKKA
ncbi:MAG: pyrroline-5-carboxylate reductase [Gudongella sp.]|jgi:pyrroline-5-carboxylate reductase|nr:pyrroline-5-carboxylate reductase [Gudongella sp.]